MALRKRARRARAKPRRVTVATLLRKVAAQARDLALLEDELDAVRGLARDARLQAELAAGDVAKLRVQLWEEEQDEGGATA